MSNATTLDLARAALRRAKRWLQGARRALEDGRWDDAVYASQMAVEHSAKGVLIAFGIEFPKVHDVSSVLRLLPSRRELPRWFTSQLEEFAEDVSELARLRTIASYGYEMRVDESYFKDYAPMALKKAEKHYTTCVNLLKEVFGVEIE
ncbi:MAG: HEPN domain-containing protein [Thermofilaceae archaeon]